MKIEVALLFMFSLGIYAQVPIEIKEGASPGQVTNFTCGPNGEVEYFGINSSYFNATQTESTTIVTLTKTIDLTNEADFPVISGNKCLKQVDIQNIRIEVKCPDSGFIENRTLIIIPKTDHNPYICDTSCSNFSNPFQLEIPENTTTNSEIIKFHLCSKDVNVQPSAYGIEITGILGERNKDTIYLKEQQDYEVKPNSMESEVLINNKPVLNISISILDSDDLGITFMKNFYECQVPENKAGYLTNCDVKAEDMDKGINAAVNYSIIQVIPTAGVFRILENGSLVLQQPLDRENNSLYNIFIKGYQVDRPNDRVNYTTLQVRVTDVDDHPPVLSAGDCNRTAVYENSPIGTIVCQLTYTDVDEGVNAENEFHINGSENKFLEVEQKTGFIKVKSLIDRESTEITKLNPVTFKVYAAPVGAIAKRSKSVLVNVTILDENDNSPSFSHEKTIISINKTQKLNVTLTQVKATDPDENENGKVNYTLLDSNVPFDLDPDSGILTLTKSLNETFLPVYQLDIRAVDQCADVHNQRSSVMLLIVKVEDVNVHRPYFFSNMSKTINISEDAPIGTIIMEIKAGDNDPTDVLTFSLQGDHEKFALEDKLLKIKGELDREKKDSYNLLVSVNDTVHVTNTSVIITVTDINDNSPNFEEKRYIFNVTEETSNAKVGDVQANDIDFGNNGKVEYYIDENSPWYSNFTISVTDKKCEIITNGKIDREKIENGHHIKFFVFAKDLGSPQRTNSSSIEITVIDINDHVPQFVTTFPNTFTVKEETLNLTNVFQVSAVDPDSGENGLVSYRIRKEPKAAGLFEVNSTSGFISLKSSPKIEACNDSMYVITVETYNPNMERNYSVLNITCNIEDVNNHSPVFGYKYHIINIFETNQLTTTDNDVCFDDNHFHYKKTCKHQAASDADCLESYSKLFYWMESNDDRFKINSSTGIISIKGGSSLDFDTLPHRNTIHFTVYASDGLYTANKTLTFNIVNRPDSLPEFSEETFLCSVDECPNTNLSCPLAVRNEDDISETRFSYSMSNGGNSSNFKLESNGTTAEIYLPRCYDFEELKNKTFTLEVQARPSIGSGGGPSCKVIITINNVNDNAPAFGNSTYKYSILETYSAGYILGKINASDADNLGELTYTLENNDYLTYTGEILRLKEVPDLDSGTLKSPISGIIYAFDGKHNGSTKVEITVIAVNEYPPEFNQAVYNLTVQENARASLTLQALDNDTGTDGTIDRYVIHVPEKWNKNITLKNDTLEILGIDRDIMGRSSMLQFTVEAVDGGTPPRTGETLVKITVDSVNDNIPKFPTDEKTVHIFRPEGATKGVLFTAKAIDQDIGAGSNVLYRLNSSHYPFQINKTSGIINCTEDLFIDKNNNGHFNIVVEAFNEGSKEFDTLTVILKLTYSNNHSPVFDNCTTSFDLIETNETHVVVGVLSAHDEDKGRNGIITFSLLDENENSPFQVFKRTNGTCVIKTVRPVDREKQDTYNLVVKATDNGINNRTTFCKLQVHVLDVNDNYPKFDESSSFYGRVKENSVQNTSLHPPTIIVTDPDNGDNGTAGLFFKLNDSSAPFCIKKTTHSVYMNVTIFVCGNIDREEKAIYYLSIIANDLNASSESLSATASLTIEIIDENDETPQFNDTHYEYNITENAFTSQIVGKVAAFDKDEKDVLKYDIVSGDYGRFYINQSGVIFVSGDVDRESMPSYTLNLSVSDGAHKNFTTVKITIIDKNDNAPRFLMYSYEEAVDVEIEENSQPGIIFNATATDQDEIGSDNSQVVYSLDVNQKGDGLNIFNITEDGILYLTGSFDRETEDYYEVNVTATDMGKPPLSTSISVHVKVLDVNDNRPEICVDGQCNVSSSNCYTIEKVPKYSVLKLLGSKDIDKGENATVSFSIESSDISKYFKIDNFTGIISVAEPLIVNNLIHEGLAENNGTVVVNLTIVATDGGGLNTTLVLYVFVEPINDDDVPVFSETVFRFNISETTITGVVVGNCSATSNDANSHMTYELISGYGRKLPTFEIDANTGNIKTKAPLDRETIDRYTLAVQVRDGRVPERTAFASVEITVDDVNDNSPTFSNDNVTLFVNENAELLIHKNVSASDNDVGLNAEIAYTLNVTNDARNHDYDGSFNISENGILTVTGKFDYEQQTQYDIVVMATDMGNKPRSSTAQVHIVVLDRNDNSPKFHNDKNFFNISEDKTSSKIFTANATDEDSGLNGQIVYKLLDTEDIPFVIDPFSGTLSLQGKLDFETRKNYTLCVLAEDFGLPRRMSTYNVTIYIKDVYDDALFFLKDTFEVFISRESKVHSSLLNLTISVHEANFSLKGRDSEYFSVGKMSGELFLKKAFDSERDVYMIQVFAEDIIGQNASATVFVYATGHQVKFDKPEINLRLQENINGTSILVDLNTTEEFSKIGVEYTIVEVKPPADSLFEVNKTTGVVTCTRALNREDTAQYTILISAATPETRKKREIQKPSSVISLIVDVDDVNDNPPFFPSDQEKFFGVPDNARGNYLVGTIRAEDPDISDVGRMKYMTIGGRTDVFGVDEDTGDIFTLVAISNTRTYKFSLSVSASDGNGIQDETELNITIHVVPTKDQPILLVNMTVTEFKKRESEYRRNMSEILGVSIQFEKIALHQITDSYGRTKLDLSRTDLIFHGINATTGMLVPNSKMKLLIKNNMERLASLFGQKFDVRIASVDTIADPSAITASQILFICMAVFIFFGSLSALVVSQYSWMRYETERQEVEKRTKGSKDEWEMSSMRSRRSRKLSSKRSSITAAAATNQAYAETELTTSSPLSPDVKSKPQYESQELRVDFNGEPLEAGSSDLNIRDDAQRVIGSGEEKISILADDNISLDSGEQNSENQQIVLVESDQLFVTGEGPLMASSPRPSRDTQQVGNGPTFDLPGNTSQNDSINESDDRTRGRCSSILLLDATGEEETDDIINDGDTNDSEGSNDNIAKYPIISEEQTINLEKESEPTDETPAAEAEMLGNTSSCGDKVGDKEEMCNVEESFKDPTDSVTESTSF